MIGTALPFTNCPTRRREALYPMDWGSNFIALNAGGINGIPGILVARTDYASNTGDGSGDQIGRRSE